MHLGWQERHCGFQESLCYLDGMGSGLGQRERGPGGAQQGLELEVVGHEEMRDFSSNTQKELLLADPRLELAPVHMPHPDPGLAVIPDDYEE